MAGLNSKQRRELYTKIGDDSLAGMLVVMETSQRTKLLQEVQDMDQALAERLLCYIRYASTSFLSFDSSSMAHGCCLTTFHASRQGTADPPSWDTVEHVHAKTSCTGVCRLCAVHKD